MDQAQLSWISNFIWGIADDVLRDVYVRGKYRDVILPMTVIRRLDALLEPTRQAVLDMKVNLDKAKIVHQDAALRTAAGQDFYNTFKWNLKDLKARSSQQQLKADFEAYLDGYSSNVQEILEKFKFRNQISTLVDANILGTMIEKFLSSTVNLSPNPVLNPDGYPTILQYPEDLPGMRFWLGLKHCSEQGLRIQDFTLPMCVGSMWERVAKAAGVLAMAGRPVPKKVQEWVANRWIPSNN